MLKKSIVIISAIALLAAGAVAGRKLLGRKIPAPEKPVLFARERPAMGGGHHGGVAAAAFSRDGKRLATGSWDATICIWDVPGGVVLATLAGHKEPVSSVAFSPDGKSLVSGGWDNVAKVWDIEARRERFTLAGHGNWVNAVAWSPDGTLIVTGGSDNVIRLWDAATGKPVGALEGHAHWVTSLAFSDDGRTLLSGSRDGTVRVWEVARRLETYRYGLVQQAGEGKVGWVAFAAGKPVSGDGEGNISVWPEPRAGSSIADQPAATWPAHLYGIAAGGTSDAGGYIVTAGGEKVFRFWSYAGKPLGVGRGHSAPVKCVAVSPDGKVVATGGWDNTVRLWDVVRAE